MHLVESQWRACPEIEHRCQAREEWLERLMSAMNVRPLAEAVWVDSGKPVRDCEWAEWELGSGGRIVTVLRHPTATSSRKIRFRLPKAKVIYDILS